MTQQDNGLKRYIRWNEQQKCSVEGCENLRKKKTRSKYCGTHHWRRHKYGHPEGRFVKRGYYNAERETVRKILVNQVGKHKGVDAGLNWIQNIITSAGRGAKFPFAEWWANLYDDAVSPLHLLIELGALTLYYVKDDGRVFKNHKSYVYHVGNRTVWAARLKERGQRYIPPRVYFTIGNQVLDDSAIGPLLYNIAGSARQWEQQEKTKIQLMEAPLIIEDVHRIEDDDTDKQ